LTNEAVEIWKLMKEFIVAAAVMVLNIETIKKVKTANRTSLKLAETKKNDNEEKKKMSKTESEPKKIEKSSKNGERKPKKPEKTAKKIIRKTRIVWCAEKNSTAQRRESAELIKTIIDATPENVKNILLKNAIYPKLIIPTK
jgi:hypothetical protein